MQLKQKIRKIHYKSRRTYGSPRIQQKLLKEGYPIGKKRVEKLMQEIGLQAVAISALYMALKQRKFSSDLLLYSDRGSQYVSIMYQLLLVKHGILCSMSGKGNCWDNTLMESFYRSLKVELIYQKTYETRRQARREIFEYIEIFCNRERLHSSLGCYSPEECEKLMLTKVS